MEDEELAWLYHRASQCETVVEVGCWMGRSTIVLSVAGHVWTVDHFQGSPSERDTAHAEVQEKDIYEIAKANLARFPNVEILKMPSLDASRKFAPGSVDMVFLDGDHVREAVLIDLLAWHPKVRKLICGHDLCLSGVQEALAAFGMPFEVGPGSLWYTEMIDVRH